MISREQIQDFFPVTLCEEEYREYYRANPDVYFYDKKGRTYKNWKEFCNLYQKTAGRRVNLPDNSPTIINYVLNESDFFFNADRDVDIVMNARYCPPFWHHLCFIKIMYVIEGELLINTGSDRTTRLEEGNFVIVPPNLKHSVFAYHDEDIIMNVFLRVSTFEKSFSTLLMEAGELSAFFWKILYGRDAGSIILFRSKRNEFLENLLLDMRREILNFQKGGNFLLISDAMAFLAHAFSRQVDCMCSIAHTQMCNDRLPDILQYIRENYATATLPVLAEHFNKSEGYLCRYIKQETGYSLTQILKEFRLRQAAVMLRETRCSVEEVMHNVGYTDISYFYKVFKEAYKTTPKKYREMDKMIIF